MAPRAMTSNVIDSVTNAVAAAPEADPMVWERILPNLSAALAVSFALVVVAAALKAGVLRTLRFKAGGLHLELTPADIAEGRKFVGQTLATETRGAPYETEQLARYYGLVLAQSKISFWFSLLFASLGFIVIIFAVFKYSANDTGGTVVQLIGGLVIDAVAALFFVQSRNAQKSMSEFFDKLRLDRQKLDGRALCDSIADSYAKDALRIQLALSYSGIEDANSVATTIIGTCLRDPNTGCVRDVLTRNGTANVDGKSQVH